MLSRVLLGSVPFRHFFGFTAVLSAPAAGGADPRTSTDALTDNAMEVMPRRRKRRGVMGLPPSVPSGRCVLFNASVAPKSRLRWKRTQESAWLVVLEEALEPGAPTCGFASPHRLGERGTGRGDHRQVPCGPAERGDHQGPGQA